MPPVDATNRVVIRRRVTMKPTAPILALAFITALASADVAMAGAPDYQGAENALRKEKKIVDLVHQSAIAEWLIGVKDDGSKRYGYAEYVCGILLEHNAIADGHMVRIVDYFKFVNTNGDHRAASLGSVVCSTGEHMFP